ncbi:MAG TPA: hypothetical protein VFV34_23095 [Blastocatellia bacterium]|nr:hypothetical protein [Blastocatellia bacterium]
MKQARLLTWLPAAALVITLAPARALSGDRSFSLLVKHIESNYHAKRQGIPLLGLARFAVKVIKPAGVKNFKLVMLKGLDFSASPAGAEFHPFVRSAIDPSWQPLAAYSSRPKQQWAYVYAQQEGEDIKFLVVTLQKQEAYVVQWKFSPEKLARFLENPEILGIPLGDRPHSTSAQSSDPPKTSTD